VKLQYLCHPVEDIQAAVSFYRDVLGWKEAWRAGDFTVGLEIPGNSVQLVLDQKSDNLPAGSQFVVESVDAFYEKHRDQVTFVWPPMDIPPGKLAAFEDPSGNVIRIMDFSKAAG
jgi:predicted enzyme related to lactoylglutathione lyase